MSVFDVITNHLHTLSEISSCSSCLVTGAVFLCVYSPWLHSDQTSFLFTKMHPIQDRIKPSFLWNMLVYVHGILLPWEHTQVWNYTTQKK